jgi:hypothetical protein
MPSRTVLYFSCLLILCIRTYKLTTPELQSNQGSPNEANWVIR